MERKLAKKAQDAATHEIYIKSLNILVEKDINLTRLEGLTSVDDELNRWIDHFSELLSTFYAGEDEENDIQPALREFAINYLTPTKSEIQRINRTLKNNKAAVPDNTP